MRTLRLVVRCDLLPGMALSHATRLNPIRRIMQTEQQTQHTQLSHHRGTEYCHSDWPLSAPRSCNVFREQCDSGARLQNRSQDNVYRSTQSEVYRCRAKNPKQITDHICLHPTQRVAWTLPGPMKRITLSTPDVRVHDRCNRRLTPTSVTNVSNAGVSW